MALIRPTFEYRDLEPLESCSETGTFGSPFSLVEREILAPPVLSKRQSSALLISRQFSITYAYDVGSK